MLSGEQAASLLCIHDSFAKTENNLYPSAPRRQRLAAWLAKFGALVIDGVENLF
jgi:hypothetical protein